MQSVFVVSRCSLSDYPEVSLCYLSTEQTRDGPSLFRASHSSPAGLERLTQSVRRVAILAKRFETSILRFRRRHGLARENLPEAAEPPGTKSRREGESQNHALDGKHVVLFHLSTILSWTILLGGIITIAVALYLVITSYSALPFFDHWKQIIFVESGGDPMSPTWLWERHNEHRPVIPKLFLAADLLLFQGRQIFLLASIFFIQLLHLVLITWSMWKLGGWRGTLFRTGTGLVAFCLFCPTQWENFVWGFQVCFVLPQLLATLSFVSLLLYSTKTQQVPAKTYWRFLVLSNAAALGATYSLASGHLLWPILILAALLLRLHRAAVLSYVISGSASTALYFYRFVAPGHHARPVFSNLLAPLKLLRFAAQLLFGFASHNGIMVGAILLVVAFVVTVIAILPALPYARNFPVFATQLLCMMSMAGDRHNHGRRKVAFGYVVRQRIAIPDGSHALLVLDRTVVVGLLVLRS